MTADFDYGEYVDSEGPGDNLLAQLAGLAAEQQEAEAEVARLEEALNAAKAALRDISEHRLPELMEEAQMDSFKTKDGLSITVKSVIRAGIPAKNPAPALAWLEDNGHGSLVKREFKIDFGKDEDAWANKFQADLQKRKKAVRCNIKKSVHPQTLQAFIRERLEAGDDIPMALFGAVQQKFTKVEVK